MQQKLRTPGSLFEGITQALAILGDDAATATGRSMDHLRHCSNQDDDKHLQLRHGLALDIACVKAGHAAPIATAYHLQLSAATGVAGLGDGALSPAERVQLLTESLGQLSKTWREATGDGRVTVVEWHALQAALATHEKELASLKRALGVRGRR